MTDLTPFREWLLSRGRSPGTADNYVADLKHALEHPDGPVARLRAKLAPKTLARIKSSLAAWARFTKDTTLQDSLDDFTLPAARRVAAKVPLTEAEWRKLAAEAVKPSDTVRPAVRTVIMLMVLRGFRVGDVLRMTRRDVQNAARTGVISFAAKRGTRLQYTAEGFRPQLEELLAKKGWPTVAHLVCTERATKKIHESARHAVALALKHVAEQAGLDPKLVHPHRLRHTYIAHVLAEFRNDPSVANPLDAVRQHVGHADISTTASYAEHGDKTKTDAVAARVMKRVFDES